MPKSKSTKAGARILASINQAAAYARGEEVEGMVRHDFTVSQTGDREVITHYVNGKRDPVVRIRKRKGE